MKRNMFLLIVLAGLLLSACNSKPPGSEWNEYRNGIGYYPLMKTVLVTDEGGNVTQTMEKGGFFCAIFPFQKYWVRMFTAEVPQYFIGTDGYRYISIIAPSCNGRLRAQ